MGLLVTAAKRRRHSSFLYHLLTTSSFSHRCPIYDPTSQLLPVDSQHHRLLSLPSSLRRDALLALARLLKTSLQCHEALQVLTSQPHSPLSARFDAGSRLAASSPALRPLASILLAALLPGSSAHLLSWCSSRDGGGRYVALRLALHAFLAAGMASEALNVLECVRCDGNTPSLSAVAALLRLLFGAGEVRAAWKVFVEMVAKGPRPSLGIFNAMILGLCHRGLVCVGAGLLGVLWRFHIIPDACSYNILIKGYCVVGHSDDVFKLFDEMLDSGCEPTVVTYNILVNFLCRHGKIVEARRLFDEMVQVGVKANTITFNVLIDGYAKCGQMDQANATCREMMAKGLVPDSFTFNILANGAYKFGKVVHLAHEHQELHEMFDPQLSTDNLDMLISRLCWDGRTDDAWELVSSVIEKGVHVSVVGFNALIASYSKEGLEEEAYEVYKLMNKIGITPSSPTLNYLIMGLCNKGRLGDAHMLLQHMIRKGCCLSTSFTIYMDTYFRSGDVLGAMKCWGDMVKLGVHPDFIAFSAYINGLCRLEYINEAYRAFIEMTRRGFVPNNITYNSLISGFCKVGNVSKALKLEQKMRHFGLLPDVFTSNILIDGFCREGRLEMANSHFLEMYSNGLTPDAVTYNTIINAYCGAQDMSTATLYMNKMLADGCVPDIFTYNIWMHSLCNNHLLTQAVKVLDELVATGCTPSPVTYNTLVDGICSDVLDRAIILTGKLIKLAFQPNTVTLNILFSQFCKQGFGKRALVWAEKFREDSVAFDDATINILDWACREMEGDPRACNAGIDRFLFLEFVMLMTYKTMRNNRPSKFTRVPVESTLDPADSNAIEVLDTG